MAKNNPYLKSKNMKKKENKAMEMKIGFLEILLVDLEMKLLLGIKMEMLSQI